ncbi:MAG: hypothetical protein CR993_05835 [Rhodobacterales bacterium]|nr:MAG: hypothetical protein CR993_05835 [Rhodobacterales bacterium]
MKDIALETASDGAEAGAKKPLNRELLTMGSETIRPFFATLDKLKSDLQARISKGDPFLTRRLNALIRRIDKFEASVTLVGQVKAGKTALANVMSGNVGLLPSDVNPWTSVVTSLHINARNADPKTRAAFNFFDDHEWDTMVKGGGRFGELAGRAGADDEMEKLRRQIEEMREAARERLSGKFEALLGKTHKYGYVDPELMERYVCLGDPDELEFNPESQQGRFSDLIKSAEIWLDAPELGGSLLVRDTPGVNDTFMVREQITIRALRGSKVCVVVLSAHEALNTTDLALTRLISNYENRQLILFVNRIDELARPGEQVPEIRDSIRSTLKRYKALKDVSIIFGSARWAEMALTSDYSLLDEEAEAAAKDWAAQKEFKREKDRDRLFWRMSGVPELMKQINERIVEDSGQRHLASILLAMQNISNEISIRNALGINAKANRKPPSINISELRHEVNDVAKDAQEKLEVMLATLRDDNLMPALNKVKSDYVDRAQAALLEHLRSNAQDETWKFNSSGLRLVLRTSYDRFAADTKTAVEGHFDDTADRLSGIYIDTLGAQVDGFEIHPPMVPKVPPPVGLGRTIAIDLSGNWWSRWWKRRRGLNNHAAEYRALIDEEINTIIVDLRDTQVRDMFADIEAVLAQFLTEQTQSILDLVRSISMHAPNADDAQEEAHDFTAMYKAALELMDENATQAGRE